MAWLFATEALREGGLTAFEVTDLTGDTFLAEGWEALTVDAGFLAVDLLGEGDLTVALFYGEGDLAATLLL